MPTRKPQPAVAAIIGDRPFPVTAAEPAFYEAVDWTFAREGGGRYHVTPGDSGGPTKWGISQKAYPTVDIKKLTRREATALAFYDYWLKSGADDMCREHEGLALYLFDAAFNMGVENATKVLQEALREVGRRIKVDGAYGPRTKAALLAQLHVDLRPHNLKRTAAGQRWAFVHILHAQRCDFYRRIRGSRKFFAGWVRRANAGLLRASRQSTAALFW